MKRSSSLIPVLLILFLLLVVAENLPLANSLPQATSTPRSGGLLLRTPTGAPTGEPERTSGSLPDWISIYFTKPDDAQVEKDRTGPDRPLAAALAQAQKSIDVAAYELDLDSVRDALLAAHQRGLAVRVVTDSDNRDGQAFQDLLDAGIPVLGDRREGLMHDKFVVIDGQEVWTGSMNFTFSDAYHNDNNLVRVRSTQLAENYSAEFNEMFVDDRFGPGSPSNTPHPRFSLDGVLLENYFSPEDGVADNLTYLINSARQSIAFLAYSFTSDSLAAAMLERASAGVSVSGVMETSQYESNQGTEYDHLRNSGVDVRLDGNPYNLHDKVILIDGQIVITGSYNFSANAENQNDENTLILHDPQVAALYLQEFERIINEAKR